MACRWGFYAAEFWNVPMIEEFRRKLGFLDKEFFVHSAGERSRNRDGVVQHVCVQDLPAGSIVKFDGNEVACPELTFLQICSDFISQEEGKKFSVQSVHRAIEIGNLFCSHIPSEHYSDENSYYRASDVSVTSVADIRSYLKKIKKVKLPGKQLAQTALRYIIDGFRSLAEIHLFMHLCLPYRYGGMGFPKPKVNKKMHLNPPNQRILNKSFIVVDLYYNFYRVIRKKTGKIVKYLIKVIIEYDSFMFHNNAKSFGADRSKSSVCNTMGFKVISFTTSQLYNLNEFYSLVQVLSRALMKRVRPKSEDFKEGFINLHAILERDPDQNPHDFEELNRRECNEFFRRLGVE